eukprot:g33583.t2
MIPGSRPSACPPWPPPEPLIQSGAVSSSSSAPWSFLDLTSPIRSQILFNLVGDLLCYSGANEVNIQLSIVRSACRELRDQIDEECLTFNYDDNCGLAKFRVLLEELRLPPNTRCSFVFEFKVSAREVEQLLCRFCVRRLSLMPEDEKDVSARLINDDPQGGYPNPNSRPSWQATPSLHVLCLRSCSDEMVQSFFSVSPRLRRLQVVDSKLQSIPSNISQNLTSLSLTGITNLPDEQLSKLLMACENLRSLYIAKSHMSHISFALPKLELLSVTHCRQLTDQCATEILSPANNPRLRFLDLSECRSLLAPTVEHPELEIAWLMHCPQLTGQAVSAMFKACTSLTAVNLATSPATAAPVQDLLRMARFAWCSLLLLQTSASFVPFADVEELKPHRLHPHCADAVDEDSFGYDGADIELNWKMHVDPDRILSLDTEAEHGVKISRCAPDELELFVPHSHLQHLEVGKFIVGSPFVHNCQHQPESAMYHKVVQVKRKRTADGGIGNMFHFHIATQAVPHMGWTAKHIEYNFSYMPVEAREIHNPWPERRSYLDHSSESRRLQGFQFPGFAQPSAGNIQSAGAGARLVFWGRAFRNSRTCQKDEDLQSEKGQSSGSMQRNNGIVSFNPDQVSNFGWNWDFFLNESKTPKFVIDQPDTQGIFILENPYIKAHAGCFLNFTSKFQGFMKAPHIIWQAGLKGHGIMQGRLRASLNSTRPMSLEASSYKIPSEVLERLENFPFLRILTKFDKTRWFNQVSHGVGPMAASFTPGFQFQMEVYHKGVFHGFLATGGSTRGVMMPILHFDSLKGFEQTIQGELLNTTVFPPLYKIFTEVFELGVRADPIFHLKGDFMGFQGVEAAMHFRAYQNPSRALVVYPFRVVGPNQLDFNTKYQLKMQAKGVEKVTSPTTSWGQVEFHEPISNCNFGNFTEAEVENVAITVILEKVDTTTGAVTQMGQGSYTVMSWELGHSLGMNEGRYWSRILSSCRYWSASSDLDQHQECGESSSCQRTSLHCPQGLYPCENVVSFLSSRIKGIGFDFPSVSLIPGQIQNEYKDLPADCPLKIHLILGNRSYLVDVNPKSMGQGAVFTGQTVIELYPSFVDMWAACATTMEFCTSPKIELWCGSQKLGSAPVPPFGIPVPEESNFIEDMLGMQPTMAPAIGTEQTNNLPAVQVTTPNNIPVATITSEVRLSPATASSSFLSPSFAADVTMGEQIEFIWTIADTVAGQAMTFKADVPGTCQARPVHGMEASALPCSFAKALAFNSPGFATGDKMIVMVTWMQDNKEHKIYSPAFRLVGGVTMPTMPVPGGTRRLQAAAAAALPPAQSNLRSPSPAPATPAPTLGAGNSSENQSEACARQDLRFNFGQGVEVRLEAAFGSVRIAFPSLGRVVQVLSMGVPQALQQDTRRGGGSAVDPKTELKSERRE